MTPAKKLWQEKEQTIVTTEDKLTPVAVDNRIHKLVKLLIIMVLYYAIIIL